MDRERRKLTKEKQQREKIHASSFISRTVRSLSSSSWFLSRLAEVMEDGVSDEDKQEGDVAEDLNDLLINGEALKSPVFKNPPRTCMKPN